MGRIPDGKKFTITGLGQRKVGRGGSDQRPAAPRSRYRMYGVLIGAATLAAVLAVLVILGIAAL